MSFTPKKNFKEFHKKLLEGILQQGKQYQLTDQTSCIHLEIDLPLLVSQLWVYERSDSSLITDNYQFTKIFNSRYALEAMQAQTSVLSADYAALATMQTAACRVAVQQYLGFCSEDSAEILPSTGNRAANLGYRPIPGAICLRILYDEEPWADVYISVVGASDSENKSCAEAAIPIVTDFFCDEQGFIVRGAQISTY